MTSHQKTYLGQDRIFTKEFSGSSLIKKIHYDSLLLKLKVLLNNNLEYEYSGVPDDVVVEFCDATSVGMYFNKVIARNYKFKRIDEYSKKESE
jgi:hypothetical protein